MSAYVTEKEAIIGLHEKGFIEDFQIRGNDLLWLREKVVIRDGEFSVLECHSFSNRGKNQPDRLIFGIYLLYENVRGILIKPARYYMKKFPPIIRKKLNELMEHISLCNSGN